MPIWDETESGTHPLDPEELPWAGDHFRMVPKRPADSVMVENLGPFGRDGGTGQELDCGVIRHNGYRVRVCWPRESS